MKLKFKIGILVLMISNCLFSQTNCDFDGIEKIQSVIELRVPNEKDIFTFLKSINPACTNNVEYLEVLNETIWKCLNANPFDFAFAFQANLNENQRQLILWEIESPNNDLIPIDKIDLEVFKDFELRSEELKMDIVESIEKARTKNSSR